MCECKCINDFDFYQEESRKTWMQTAGSESEHTEIIAGIGSEVGEFLGKVQKYARGDYHAKHSACDAELIYREDAAKELGDILYYVSRAADRLGYTLSDVAALNLDKVNRRYAAGTTKGDGDHR